MLLTVDPTDEFFERINALLNSRLSKRVVVLNAVEQFGETPKTVRFQLHHVGRR